MRKIDYRNLIGGLGALIISIRSYFLDYITLPGPRVGLDNHEAAYYIFMVAFFVGGVISLFFAFRKKDDDL